MIWYKDNNSDIIISTRIRLARNLKDTPIPASLTDKAAITQKIKDSILASNSTLSKSFEFVEIDTLSPE